MKRKYQYWNRERATEKRYWLKFSAESVPRNNLPLITLCTHSQFCWAVGRTVSCPNVPSLISPALVVSHGNASSASMGYPSCEHPSTPPSTGMPCGTDSTATKASPSVLEELGTTQTSLCGLLQMEIGGKTSTPSMVRSYILQKPGSVTAKIVCGWAAQWTVHRLQAEPSADGICVRPTRCPWLCPRLWNNPLRGVCQQQNPGTMGC